MPKPIINTKNDLTFIPDNILENRVKYKSSELAFRKQRPEEYVNILKDLDVGGQTMSQDKIKDIVEKVIKTCPEIILEDTFIGVLGKCLLGGNYDVHTLSINEIFVIDEATHLPGFGRLILKHYLKNDPLPEELEKARALARNPQYAFVEVYTNKIIAISNSGTTAIIAT